MGVYTPDIPQRDIYGESAEALQAQIDLAPERYAQDSIYGPLYQLLGLQNMQTNLLGFDGGTIPLDAEGNFAGGIQSATPLRDPAVPADPNLIEGRRPGAGADTGDTTTRLDTTQTAVPSTQGDGSGLDAGGTIPSTQATTPGQGPVSGGIATGTQVTGDIPRERYEWNGQGWELYTTPVAGPRAHWQASGTILDHLPSGYEYEGQGGISTTPQEGTPGATDAVVPGQMGLLELFGDYVAPALTGMETTSNTARRAADIADVGDMGADFRAAYENANPEQAALMAELNAQAMEGLGEGLTDFETRAVGQGVAGAQSARGFGFGPSDVFEEAVAQTVNNQARKQSNQQFGLQVSQQNQATALDPFLALTGRTSQGGAAAGAAAASGAFAPGAQSMFDPFSAYAADLNSSNQSAAGAASTAGANNRAGIASGILSY
jgi:hypothetical protein